MYGIVEFGVVEDDEGCVAAEFHRGPLHSPGAIGDQLLPDLCRAGEGQLANGGIRGQLFANRAGPTGKDVDDPGRDAGPLGQLGHGECRKRRRGSGFADRCAARRERGPDLAGQHRVGEVPRCDARHYTDRLFDDDDAAVVGRWWNHIAIDALGLLREPFDIAGAVGDLTAGLGEWLALLGGQDSRQVFLVLHHQIEPAPQEGGSLGGRPLSPGDLGAIRRLDGATGLVTAAFRDLGDDLAGGWIRDRKGLAAVGVDPLPVDKGLGS